MDNNEQYKIVLVKKKDLGNKWKRTGQWDEILNKIYIPKKIKSFQHGDSIIKYQENKNSIKAQLILPIQNQKKGINNRCIKDDNNNTRLNFRNKQN